MQHVFLFSSISQEIGLGHRIRLEALSFYLNKNPLFWVTDSTVDSSLLPPQVLTLKSEDVLKSKGILIVDHKHYPPWIEKFQGPIVCIDDFGRKVKADIIINGSVLADKIDYHAYKPDTLFFKGPAYTLLRPEFKRSLTPRPKDFFLTVVIGSGLRAKKFLEVIIHKVLPCFEEKCALVIPQSQETPDLSHIKNVEVFKNITASELSNVFNRSQKALITSGMVMYECTALGIPSFVFPYTEESLPEVKWFEEQGLIINLGYDEGMEGQHILKALNQDISSLKTKLKTSYLDGCGAERVANHLKKEYGLL
jgi:spore coat polysaccharide biosynthesis predicted glycosyltransferase SpsG